MNDYIPYAFAYEGGSLSKGISFGTPAIRVEENKVFNPITRQYCTYDKSLQLIAQGFLTKFPKSERNGDLTVEVNYDPFPKCIAVIWYGPIANQIRGPYKADHPTLGTTSSYIICDNKLHDSNGYEAHHVINLGNGKEYFYSESERINIDIMGQSNFYIYQNNKCKEYYDMFIKFDNINDFTNYHKNVIKNLLCLNIRHPELQALKTILSDDIVQNDQFNQALFSLYENKLEIYNKCLDFLKGKYL